MLPVPISDDNPLDLDDGIPWLHLPRCVETRRDLHDYDFDRLELLARTGQQPVFRRRPHPDDVDGLWPTEARRVNAVEVSGADDGETRSRALVEEGE